MWESIEHANGKTLWLGRDPEGSDVFAVTADQSGMCREPSGMRIFYDLSEAREELNAKEDA